MEIFGIIISVVISVISLIVSWSVQNKQVKLQERMVKLEEARDLAAKEASRRAAVTCILTKVPASSGMRHVLRLHNSGPSAARNVQVKIDGTPHTKHPCVWNGHEIPILGPGSRLDISLQFHSGTPRPPFVVTIAWEDDAGVKDPPYQTTVNW